MQFLLDNRVYGKNLDEMRNTLRCYNIVLAEISMHPDFVRQLAQYWYNDQNLGIATPAIDDLPSDYIRLSNKLHILYTIDQIQKDIMQKHTSTKGE